MGKSHNRDWRAGSEEQRFGIVGEAALDFGLPSMGRQSRNIIIGRRWSSSEVFYGQFMDRVRRSRSEARRESGQAGAGRARFICIINIMCICKINSTLGLNSDRIAERRIEMSILKID